MSRPGKIKQAEREYILTNYKKYSNAYMANELGLSRTAVWKFLTSRGLTRTKEEKRKMRKSVYIGEKRPSCKMEVMIKKAQAEGYENATHAISVLGPREFKKRFNTKL